MTRIETPASTKPGLRPAAAVVLALGALVLLLDIDLLQGNPELATPGQALVTGAVQEYWRLVFGLLGFIGGVLLLIGWILVRRLRPLAFVAVTPMFAVFPVLVVLPGLVPSAMAAYAALIAFAIVVPALLALWANRLGRPKSS